MKNQERSFIGVKLPMAWAIAVSCCALFSAITVMAADTAPASKSNGQNNIRQKKTNTKVVGKAVKIKGTVLARNTKDETIKMRELKLGSKIYEGDVINTSSNAGVKILFADRTILDLGSSTLFKVDEFKMKKGDYKNRKVGLSMMYGKIRASVNKKLNKRGRFRIKAKGATMGVRGTEFSVTSGLLSGIDMPGISAAKTTVTVIEGQVNTTPAGSSKAIPLKPGQKFTAKIEDKAGRSMASNQLDNQNVEVTEVQVEEVGIEAAKAEVEEVKIKNDHAREAITINADSDGSGGSNATMELLADMTLDASALDGGTDFIMGEGTFGPGVGFDGSYYPGVINGSSVNLTVTFGGN